MVFTTVREMKEKNVKKVLERKEIPDNFKWKLEKMYENDELWEKDIIVIHEMANRLVEYMGKLGESSEKLWEALMLNDELSQKLENVFVYAKMRKDEDNRMTKYQAMSDKAQGLVVQVQSKLAFMIPEIIQIPEETIMNYLKTNEKLKRYTFFFEGLFRKKEHILTKEEEKILAQMGELAAAPQNIFTMINNADIKFPSIKDENRETIEVTKGRYIKLVESSNRQVRKDAFKALYASYTKQKNTIAATLNYSVKKDILYARARKYKSALEASLDEDHIPITVYDQLIKTVENHLGAMYRYVRLRKRALKVDTLHMYDLYTPIVKKVDMKISYQEAKNQVKKGLKPLGEEYISILQKGFDEGWIDVYENEGKTSGAYSFGTYQSFPYVLLNYQDSIHDLFTLAHEMGHSLHSYYSNKNQTYIYSGYKIFVAEVASTVNEALLMEYLLKNTRDQNKKMYLMNHFLEQFRGTVYRQTMFAEFEKIIHEKAEQGEALTPENLCQLYGDLNKKYYGLDMVIDDEIKMEWSRIPHFYNAFYVYKYATGYSAAISLSQKILNGGDREVGRYLNFLKSGGSDYPIPLLKGAGVDMTTSEPIESALKVFEALVSEMEKMIF